MQKTDAANRLLCLIENNIENKFLLNTFKLLLPMCKIKQQQQKIIKINRNFDEYELI